MRTRLASFVVFTLLLSSTLAAQTPPYLPANEPNANALVADRIRFVRDMYTLDPATMAEVTKALTALAPFHAKQLAESSKTVERIKLAMTIVANDSNVAPAEKPNRIANFQRQIYNRYAGSPLSLASVIKLVDAKLTPDRVQAARGKMMARFAGPLKGAALDVTRMDELVILPARLGPKPEIMNAMTPPPPQSDNSQAAAAPIVPQTVAQVAPSEAKKTFAPPPSTPPVKLNPAVPPIAANAQPPLPPNPPHEIKPAPPKTEWAGFLDNSATKFGFSADQKKSAEKIFEQVKTRADKVTDNTAKSDKPGENAKPLDKLYDELVQRVESLASTEQRAKVEKAAPAGAKPPASSGK